MHVRKYQVFVSSTFKDLEPARKAAIKGISLCGHIPVGLDSFAPESKSDRDVIKREAKGAHVYVLILGPCYGSIPKGESKSFTEIEYDIAERAGKPTLVFALDWSDVQRYRRRLKATREEDRKEIAKTRRLERFYRRVREAGKHFYAPWRLDHPEEITALIVKALDSLAASKRPPRGLVPELSREELKARQAVKNKFLRGTIDAVQAFSTLYRRTDEHIDEKQRAGQFFAECYSSHLLSPRFRGAFFESGSSPAYLATNLPDRFWSAIRYSDAGEPNRRILTNNVLVYLYLWLERRVPVGFYPWGEPERTYGASYGPITNLPSREPEYSGQPLDKQAIRAIDQLRRARGGLNKHDTSLIVLAASGLQLGRRHTIASPNGFALSAQARRELESCYGPHVGSYENKVFKRYLCSLHLPTVLLSDANKIDCPIDATRCHFLFGKDLSWSQVLRTQPLAICIGCKTAELRGVKRMVATALAGFRVSASTPYRAYSAVLATNASFDRAFPRPDRG